MLYLIMYCYVFICILGINPAPHLPNGTLTRFPPSPLNQCTLLSGNLKRQPPHLQLPSQQGSRSVVWMQQKTCSLCARSLANAAFRCLSQLLMRYIKFIIPSLSMLILPYYLTFCFLKDPEQIVGSSMDSLDLLIPAYQGRIRRRGSFLAKSWIVTG